MAVGGAMRWRPWRC